MRPYKQRYGKDKDGARREAPPFSYVDAGMFLLGQQKWSTNTPGIPQPNDEGSK